MDTQTLPIQVGTKKKKQKKGGNLSREIYFGIELANNRQATELTDYFGKVTVNGAQYKVRASPICFGCKSRDHIMAVCPLPKMLALVNGVTELKEPEPEQTEDSEDGMDEDEKDSGSEL